VGIWGELISSRLGGFNSPNKLWGINLLYYFKAIQLFMEGSSTLCGSLSAIRFIGYKDY